MPSQLFEAAHKIGLPAILKTRRLGYDGKGQHKIEAGGDPAAAWRALHGASCILEGFVPFEREISVVVARGGDGTLQSFDVTENEHRDHILKVSRVPAAIPPAVARRSCPIAEAIATAFDYVGVLAVEMFVLRDGHCAARAGQRDRAAGPQFRALDHRRLHGLAIRAAYPRGRRLAAGRAGPARAGRDDQPDRRRSRRLCALAHHARRLAASLRQGRSPSRPQDGARHAGAAGIPDGSPAPRRPRGCAIPVGKTG